MRTADFLSRLNGVRTNGTGFMALCPGHDDDEASLSIAEVDSKILLHCHAGCSPEAIVGGLGLTMADLFIDDSKKVSWRTEYPIRNRQGELIATHIRLDHEGGKKSFVWQRNGVMSLGGLKVEELPLYNTEKLDTWSSHTPLIVTEGEKAAMALESWGIQALGTVTGASATPGMESLRVLSDWDGYTYLWPDKDTPGRAHMDRIATRLSELGKSCRLIHWPEAPAKGDAADFVVKGTPEALQRLISDATQWTPKALSDSKFKLTVLSDLMAEPEEIASWLWDKALPTGGLSLIAAKPKIGKSTLARNLALQVSRGEPFLGRDTSKGAVIYLALEEKRAEVAAHFARMGAKDEPILIHTGSAPEEALLALGAAIKEKGAVLSIVDPLLRMVRLRDGNDYVEVTRALEPLLMLARDTGCHILAVHHMGKSDREGGDSILGSTALFAAVDTALIMRRRDNLRTLESIQRYGLDIERLALEFDPETGLTEAAGTIADIELKQTASAVCDILGDGELTEKEIREKAGGNTGLVGKSLRWLLAEGYIGRNGSGKRNDAYVYFLVSRFTYMDKQEKREKQDNFRDRGQEEVPFLVSENTDSGGILNEQAKLEKQPKREKRDIDTGGLPCMRGAGTCTLRTDATQLFDCVYNPETCEFRHVA